MKLLSAYDTDKNQWWLNIALDDGDARALESVRAAMADGPITMRDSPALVAVWIAGAEIPLVLQGLKNQLCEAAATGASVILELPVTKKTPAVFVLVLQARDLGTLRDEGYMLLSSAADADQAAYFLATFHRQMPNEDQRRRLILGVKRRIEDLYFRPEVLM